MSKRIGILGGTFDPVHNGHIGLAEDARDQAGLDQVLLMPAKLQPFKLNKKVTEGRHRLEMLQLAVAPLPGIAVSDYELQQDQISYTYKTLDALSQQNPGARLFFITGTDAFLKIHMWREAEEMLRRYSFAVGVRPGYRETELDRCIEQLKTDYNTDIVKLTNRKRDISATEIRERLEKGRPLTGLVPETVERYIRKHGLY